MAQASRKKTEGRRIPGWLWFVSGLFVGAVAMYQLTPQESPNLKQKLQERLSKNEAEKKQQEAKAPKPRFDFYTVLPEMEVVIPEEEIQRSPKPEPKPVAQEKPAEPEQSAQVEPAGAAVYLLQMGSFRSYADADRLKARLGFMGIESDIQSVTISNEQGRSTVHRVRGGPYSQTQAQALHKSLKENQINSMMIRLKN